MKNTIFLAVTAALTISTASFGQQTSPGDMSALARALVEHIPEIDGAIVKTEKIGENLIRCEMQEAEGSGATLQIYRYKRPAAATDWVLVSYDISGFPAGAWIKCFTLDRKTGALAETELPFKLLPPMQFDREEFDEDHGYWRTVCRMYDNGNVLIDALPGMSYHCVMLVRYDKGAFTTFRRAGYGVFAEPGDDNAETERYVQNVVRPNFQRINAIGKWAYVEEKDIDSLSTGGATHTCYYSDRSLEKMILKLYGETGRKTVEYYFLDGQLSFIYDVTTPNGAPNTKTERRWYLKGNTCIRGIGDDGKKLTPVQTEEEFLDGDRGAYSLYMKMIEL